MTENSSPALNATMSVETKRPCPLHMSRRRYQLIKDVAEKVFVGNEDGVEVFLKELCVIMKFDPDVGIYTPERGKIMMEKLREKAAALGVSTYEVSGSKKYYHENKEELNRRRNVLKQRKRDAEKNNV